MTAPLLAVTDLQSGYGDSQVLFGVTLQVHQGEVVSLLGRNGMGKTTTISTIMGIVRARAGEVAIAGETVTALPTFRIAHRGIGLVPEGRQIFPNLTVSENLIAMAANRTGRPQPWTLPRVLDLFPALNARLHSPGSLLSGGEQQMLAIGRALMTNPKLLILDEATEGLAPLIREDIWRVLERLRAAGQSIIVVDKNIDALTRIATRHYILEKGRIVWTGTSAELRGNPDLQHRYIGV
ncbi:ABC transporter ATP-binding protein [Roseiarcaceae bacterium H3SJ34-1]|uniref:ABC transporter ATP-binding protein n=1 Tax=Terripilifer ovatus TaxID=3032367 RepID=UPI003AB92F46|nr:ABC transporter ATP-binding protein [Roseiarcaceae bacterium H3SJ34-1]